MAKFYGMIGYGETAVTSVDTHVEIFTERPYIGEVLSNARRLQGTQTLNDNVVVSNRISIIADPYAYQNFHTMRYATYMNAKWKITNVEVQYPRLILTLGDVYNAE